MYVCVCVSIDLRALAPLIFKMLQHVQQLAHTHTHTQVGSLRAAGLEWASCHPSLHVDYLLLSDATTGVELKDEDEIEPERDYCLHTGVCVCVSLRTCYLRIYFKVCV